MVWIWALKLTFQTLRPELHTSKSVPLVYPREKWCSLDVRFGLGSWFSFIGYFFSSIDANLKEELQKFSNRTILSLLLTSGVLAPDIYWREPLTQLWIHLLYFTSSLLHPMVSVDISLCGSQVILHCYPGWSCPVLCL